MNKKVKYHGTIIYTMDKNHPDIKYISDWTEEKVFTFDDVYIFNKSYCYSTEEESLISYIKSDLSLVAGGGYNTEHIHNVDFDIKRVY